MRKVYIIILSLFSVLVALGQEQKPFEYNSVQKFAQELKQKQDVVLEQASKSPRISDEDKTKANEILTNTFESLDKVFSVYNDIKEDPDLVKEAEEIIINFLNKYSAAILSDNKKRIQVSTRVFLSVAEESSSDFNSFYNKAQEYINQHNKGDNQTIDAKYDDKAGGVNQEAENANGENSKSKTSYQISIWALIVGALGAILGLFALLNVQKAHKRIEKRKAEILKLEKSLNPLIKKINGSSNCGSTKALEVQHKVTKCPPYAPHKPQNAESKNLNKEQSNRNNTITEQKSTTTNLFATSKADSSCAEFYRVSPDNNNGDKVFMLTLANPDAEIADFTIVSNMPSDFLKSVINDRDTYLPILFCDKLINSQNPTKIEVSSQGKAKKVDGKWQVQERMSIRLV